MRFGRVPARPFRSSAWGTLWGTHRQPRPGTPWASTRNFSFLFLPPAALDSEDVLEHGARVRAADADDVKRNIGRRIAELRIKLGLTQAELADRVGVSSKYLQRIEWGQENLTVASIVGLANVLDVAPIAFFKPARLRNAGAGRPPLPKPRPKALRISKRRIKGSRTR